tara:strand:+ start:34646 stop:36106 length:1461 start_codon:yes stop_codon:yes gene_type:complete
METIVGVKDLVLGAPLLVLFFISILPLTIKVLNNNKEQRPYAVLLQAWMGLIIAGSLYFLQSPDAVLGAFDTALIFDGVNRWMSVFLILISGFCLFMSADNIQTRGSQFSEHTFLVLSSLIGMLIMSASSDLIVTFIGLELMSISLYVLVALSKEQVIAKEAAFKYFILGSLASAIMLYGIALMYGSSGTTYLPDIGRIVSELLVEDVIYQIGSLLLLVGLLFKVSIFPFHAWTPDVYQGAPTPITAFMSTGVKVATFSFLIRLFSQGIYEGNDFIIQLLQVLIVLTILVGNIGAIIQSNLKRMLSYSSIAHSGYVLIGILVLAVNPRDGLAVAAVMFYLFAYAIVNIGSFGIVSLKEKDENKTVFVNDLNGMAKTKPITALIFTVFMLSLTGIPPLIGFFGKLYLFSSALQYEFYWVAMWGVIGSVISVYYYLRPVVNMYMREADKDIEFARQDLNTIGIGICFLLVLLFGILSSNVLNSIQVSL